MALPLFGRLPHQVRIAGLAAIFVAGTVGATALYAQIAQQAPAVPGDGDDVRWTLPPPPAHLAADPGPAATPVAPIPEIVPGTLALPTPPATLGPASAVANEPAMAAAPPAPALAPVAAPETPAATSSIPPAAIVAPLPVKAAAAVSPPPVIKPASGKKKMAQMKPAAPKVRASKSAQTAQAPHLAAPRRPVDQAHLDPLPLPPMSIEPPPPPPATKKRIPVVSSVVDGMSYVGNKLTSLVTGD